MGATYGTVGTQASKQSSDHLMRDQESRKRLRENTLFSEIAGTSAFGQERSFNLPVLEIRGWAYGVYQIGEV
jgi:hypothetical protein